MSSELSRREFLKRASALSITGIAAPFALNLAAIGEAAAATATDYKALVCVFMYGGNDYANTLVPYDTASYNLQGVNTVEPRRLDKQQAGDEYNGKGWHLEEQIDLTVQPGNTEALIPTLGSGALKQVLDRHDAQPEGYGEKMQLKQKIKSHAVLLSP